MEAFAKVPRNSQGDEATSPSPTTLQATTVRDGGGRERNLTENEIIVIKSLLATSPESGEDRIRRSGLPRSTYRDAKRRIYASGILEDRYVPSPAATGFNRVYFFVARPFTDQFLEASRRLSELSGTVVCWTGPQVLFGVIFSQSGAISGSLVERARRAEFGIPGALIDVAPNPANIPVYFDFEGAWVHFTSSNGSVGYPRAIPHVRNPDDEPRFLQTREASMLRQLLLRPILGEGRRREPHLFGPAALPQSLQRWLDKGLVDWRVLLSLENPAAYRGISVSELLFVWGTLRERRSLQSFTNELTEEAGVFPFLAVGDGTRVLIASLATGRFQTSDQIRAVTTRFPVTPILSRNLNRIESIRQPLAQLKVVVNHRYDRLVPA
jgi:hypothetical protein